MNGNMVNWWQPETVARFNRKTECMVQQYNNYSIDGSSVSCSRDICYSKPRTLHYISFRRKQEYQVNRKKSPFKQPTNKFSSLHGLLCSVHF